MPRIVLMVCIALALVATSVPALFASSAQHTATFMNSPISPLNPHPGDDGEDNDHGGDAADPYQRTGPVASGVVWGIETTTGPISIKTHQIGVGWWDAEGHLHVELQVHGIVNIPAEATMISIPWDAAGVLAPPGWKKMMRPDGEWVIVRITT